MNPGKLDRRIILQVRTLTKDATGSKIETWADHANVFAEYVITKGSEAKAADADRSISTQQFRIRYRALSTTDYRILYKSRVYDITGISEEGRQTALLLDTVTLQSVS